MGLSAGMQIGPYEVVGPIGAGAMGQVYRALDTRLGRGVALKILPDEFTHDSERLARFQREAQVLAALNHPHIATIHGIEDAGGAPALVMELVEGPTLGEYLANAHGALELNDAVAIARQIAAALEAAHEKGIIHRDLKPANIKVRDDGCVKVLDFGLAKSVGAMPVPSDVANSPTITTPAMTAQGVLLGTAAYMSPEQARGRAVDKRADIWAFGVVFYEMLTGRRLFSGASSTDVIAQLLTAEPDWNALAALVPAPVFALVKRCLIKDPSTRLRDIGEARIALGDGAIAAAPASSAAAVASPSSLSRSWPLATAALLAVAIGVPFAVWRWNRPEAATADVQRFNIAVPEGAAPIDGSIAVSNDGRRLLYSAEVGGRRMLYLRTLDQLEPVALPGTEQGYAPFFSPDGSWIGFFTDRGPNGALKKMAVTGGPAQVLCTARFGFGGFWTFDNDIIFSTDFEFGHGARIGKIPAAGGAPQPLTSGTTQRVYHGWPQLLPDGRSILYTVFSPALDAATQPRLEVYAAGQQPKIVLANSMHGRYADGRLLYVQNGALMSSDFDTGAAAVRGSPVTVAKTISGQLASAEASFGAAPTGLLVYAPGRMSSSSAPPRDLVWVTRDGKTEAVGLPPGRFGPPRLSPDGTRIAVPIDGRIGIWDIARRVMNTIGAGAYPTWTGDGRRVIYTQATPSSIVSQAADGSSAPETLYAHQNFLMVDEVTRSGARLLFRIVTAATGHDIHSLSLPDRQVAPLLTSAAAEVAPAVSPDGRWLAYESSESGEFQVFVRPFPGVTTARWLVSAGDGRAPLWSADGRSLYYWAGGAGPGQMMSVNVDTASEFRPGVPKPVFEGHFVFGVFTRYYDITPDGRRFLMLKRAAGSAPMPPAQPLVVTLNWKRIN